MTTQLSNPSQNFQSSDQKIAYQERIEAELKKLDARIAEYRAKVSYAQADAQAEYHSIIEQLDVQRKAFSQRLEEMKASGNEAWGEIQSGVDKAWRDIEKAFNHAADKFNELK